VTGPTDPVLLDTNVVVYLIRWGELGQRIAEEYELLTRAETPLISAVTLGEARSLALQLGWGAARSAKLQALLRSLVVVGIDREPVLDRYAQIDQLSRRSGRRMEKNDVWIAASAAAAGAVLLTTDADFGHIPSDILRHVRIDVRRAGA
jgi:tRNA(fMet)-specific endonuclease VapC